MKYTFLIFNLKKTFGNYAHHTIVPSRKSHFDRKFHIKNNFFFFFFIHYTVLFPSAIYAYKIVQNDCEIE